MKTIIVKNQLEGGKVAFDLLKESLAAGAQTLGLATGSSPIALYQEMVESDVDFSELYSVNLDEYVGLAPDHEQSYHAFMQEHLLMLNHLKRASCLTAWLKIWSRQLRTTMISCPNMSLTFKS
ncbi:Glucosamine-6-phosphate deaminase [Streptococcus sp. HSISS2]|nr:Glucosamine-6-phosphate deaminase [Streptococcus sp. HSISS2]